MNLKEQREKILSGQMYNDLTNELVKAREDAVYLTNEYNASYGKPTKERETILKKLLKSIGEGVYFEPNFRCEFGYNITIGNNFYANFDCVMLDGGGIEIGDNVLLGPRVGIYTSNHAIDAWQRAHSACYAKPVKIETTSGLAEEFKSIKALPLVIIQSLALEVSSQKIYQPTLLRQVFLVKSFERSQMPTRQTINHKKKGNVSLKHISFSFTYYYDYPCQSIVRFLRRYSRNPNTIVMP